MKQWIVCAGLLAAVFAAGAMDIKELDATLRAATAEADALRELADAPSETRHSSWVGPESSAANQWTCFRTTLLIDRSAKQTRARIAADSKYWLWINGRLVVREGQLKRGPAPDATYYDVVDLTPYVHAGTNTAAVLLWHFGREGFSHKSSGRAGLLFELDSTLAIYGPWMLTPHPAFSTASGPAPNFRLPESNLRFDATRDPGDWFAPGFDDSAWTPATTYGKAGDAPWGPLFARPTPLWMDEQLQPVEKLEHRAGRVVAKLPFNQRFTPWIEVEGPAGQVLELRTDSAKIGSEWCVRAEYVTREGRQSYEFPGWLSGHELQMTVPSNVTVHAVKYRPHNYRAAVLGSFDCDDPDLVSLWKKAERTLTINMHDTWSDCPDRERAQWWGDVVIDLGQTPYTLDPRAELISRKGFLEVARWQRADGTIFSPVPAGNWEKELPPQLLATVGPYGLGTYLRNNGDVALLRQMYPAVKRYLLEPWQLDARGLVVHRKGGWDWADWGEHIDASLLDNAWYLLALEAAAGYAKQLGLDADVPAYTERAQKIRAAFHAANWRDTHYRSDGYTGEIDERGHAMAILAGLVPREHREAVHKVILEGNHASPYMEKYILEALFDLGDDNGAIDRMKRRYAKMISDPSTTLWENFPTGGTFNHAWSGGPLTLLAERVAGVRPTSPRFATFDVMPAACRVTRLDLRVPSPQGVIEVHHKTDGTRSTLRLRVPDGATARAALPPGFESNWQLNDKPAATVKTESGRMAVELKPGVWELAGTTGAR